MASTTFSGPLTVTTGPITVDGTAISSTELGYLDSITPGTATASKAVVLDASKGIATITSATITTLTSTTGNVTTVNATNVDAGASGTAGSVDVFPSTASKGKVSITAADSAGDTTTSIVNASQSGARTYTIPDAGASASFVMSTGTSTGISATSTQLNYLSGVTAGTSAASKALVLDSNSKINAVDVTALTLNGTALGSTAAEIDQICDASASSDTRTGAGAISIDKAYTSLVTTAADALTLAAPGAASIPRLKVIHMTTDGGDGTLASTNIVGQSAGSTSITFNDAGDYLVLVSVPGLNKWSVVKEGGVTAA